MNKETIVVSAEVKTYLMDLYNQIEYELRDDYKDSLEKTTKALFEIKELIENRRYYENGIAKLDDNIDYILDIVNKALEGKNE